MKKVKKSEILSLLKKRDLEDFKKLAVFEKILSDERGHVFKMPRRGSNVILLLSGGLDSIVIWGILMKEYGLNVYPITFDRGEKRKKREFASVKFFDHFYKNRYPVNYRKFTSFNVAQNDASLSVENGVGKLTEKAILDNFKDGKLKINGSLGIFTILPFFARSHAMYLNSTKNLSIDTIFCAVTAEDGEHVPFQTLTSLRSISCNLCVPMKDYSWQFSSLCLEPEIDSFLKKSDLIKWAFKNNLPLEKTWSCYHGKRFQCGGSDCMACVSRRSAFKTANVKDETIYKSIDEQKTNLKNLKRIIKELLV